MFFLFNGLPLVALRIAIYQLFLIMIVTENTENFWQVLEVSNRLLTMLRLCYEELSLTAETCSYCLKKKYPLQRKHVTMVLTSTIPYHGNTISQIDCKCLSNNLLDSSYQRWQSKPWTGRWFSPGHSVSCTNKTDRHHIT
jgi:hypothetical protein